MIFLGPPRPTYKIAGFATAKQSLRLIALTLSDGVHWCNYICFSVITGSSPKLTKSQKNENSFFTRMLRMVFDTSFPEWKKKRKKKAIYHFRITFDRRLLKL